VPRSVASRSPRAEEPAAQGSEPFRHRRSAARQTCHSPASCNSLRNADVSAASEHLVRITHPFHPFANQQFVCVGERYNRSGKRLLLRVDDRTVCSVPPQWTDIVAPDPEVLMGGGRTLFRVVDLLELARLVTRLSSERRSNILSECKDDFAAHVRELTPQRRDNIGRMAKHGGQSAT